MIKKVVQQDRSDFDARSVLPVREHSKMARTLLAAFFNIPLVCLRNALEQHELKICPILRQRVRFTAHLSAKNIEKWQRHCFCVSHNMKAMPTRLGRGECCEEPEQGYGMNPMNTRTYVYSGTRDARLYCFFPAWGRAFPMLPGNSPR